MPIETVECKMGGCTIELVNCTPHDVTVYSLDGGTPLITIPKSGTIIRVAETVVQLTEKGVPLVKVERDPNMIEGLPEKVNGRALIVSDIAYQAARALGREDVVRTGPAVRDDAGRIIGCRGLAI